MAKNITLDANIIIDILAQNLTLPMLESLFPDSILNTSFMTRVELLSFPQKTPSMEKMINNFLATLHVVPYSETIEKYAIDVRFSTGLKIPDSFIFATALEQNALLITNDIQLLQLKWSGLKVCSTQ
ncbi:MAG: PIN domain-containing protein [Deltaproteobacteria bacterium]|jgi:predicted nucleic acid-binding protein|nr:PIN domain-containing protein [Deltaproteobacteria bacterium]